MMKIQWGRPKKCICVKLFRKWRWIPWIERELPGEVFFGWLFVSGYVYW